jgi:hypothetical protein
LSVRTAPANPKSEIQNPVPIPAVGGEGIAKQAKYAKDGEGAFKRSASLGSSAVAAACCWLMWGADDLPATVCVVRAWLAIRPTMPAQGWMIVIIPFSNS